MAAIISWLVLGLVAGFLAKKIMPGDEPGGFIITILLGIGGAIVGGYFGSFFGLGISSEFSFKLIGSILLATGGAVLLIWFYNKLKKNGSRTPN